MSKVKSFLPWDCSTLATYKAWAQGIGNALSTLGWSKTTDTGQVNWANVTSVPNGSAVTHITSFSIGAWAGGTSYTAPSGNVANVVTNSGLTYFCIVATQLTLTQALQNSTATLGTVTAVANSSGGTAIYTVASGVVSTMVGQQFVVTGMGSANNNGTFICTATSGTTSITLSNPNATTASAQTGSASSSASVLSFIGTITSGGGNAFVGHSFVTSISGSGNSGTFTVTSSSAAGFAVTATGTTTVAAGTATENTAPASDPIHWAGYNYEVWQSSDSLSSTSPLYLRFVYTSSNALPEIFFQVSNATSGSGYLTGNAFNGGLELTYSGSGSLGADNLFECDFSQYEGSFGMCLWRTAYSSDNSIPFFLALDRAKDNFGNDLDTFTQVLLSCGFVNGAQSQVIFKPSINAVMPFNSNATWNCPYFGASTSTAWNGTVAAFPIFPIVGYVANPCLQAVGMIQLDVENGALFTAILYGTQHTYLATYGTTDFCANQRCAACLRWD